jgi:hypothetical protein
LAAAAFIAAILSFDLACDCALAIETFSFSVESLAGSGLACLASGMPNRTFAASVH